MEDMEDIPRPMLVIKNGSRVHSSGVRAHLLRFGANGTRWTRSRRLGRPAQVLFCVFHRVHFPGEPRPFSSSSSSSPIPVFRFVTRDDRAHSSPSAKPNVFHGAVVNPILRNVVWFLGFLAREKGSDRTMHKPILALVFVTMIVDISAADAISGRFLATLFGYHNTCFYKNHVHRCTFTFTCWLVGGNLEGGCGDDYDWLFTCCVPSLPVPNAVKVTEHKKQLISRAPLRRQDLVRGGSCGVPAIRLQKRIIGGNEAYFGEFPWQAHIRIAGYQCGGVLVSQWFVATAAHCIHRARLKDIKVYLGEYDTQNTGNYIEPLPEEIHKVSKKILHPYFQFRITQPDRFDVALLKLSRKVQYRENILPICLPEPLDSFEGYTGVVAGWGKTDTTYGKTGTNVLQKAGVPILSDEECLQWHQHKNIMVELHKEMFCAGHSDGHMDACLGDSGGPLIVLHNGKWTLAGITSAGFGCAVDHQPGIYHKVAFTSNWINGVINNT